MIRLATARPAAKPTGACDMIRLLLLGLAALAVIAILVGDDTAAMAECQQRHTYDTCFRALYR